MKPVINQVAAISTRYREERERLGKLNVLLKLYEVGEIATTLTDDYRIRYVLRTRDPECSNTVIREHKWSFAAIERVAKKHLRERQKAIQNG
jgi:hypothetical protein